MTKESEPTPRQRRLELLTNLINLVFGAGLPRTVYDAHRKDRLDSDLSIGEAIDTLILTRQAKWDKDRLVRNLESVDVTLDPQEESTLRDIVNQAGQEPEIIVKSALRKFLGL